jgi:alpha-D-xyloside xylohydrolase
VDRPRLVAAPPARSPRDFEPKDPRVIQRIVAATRRQDRLVLDAVDDKGASVPIEILPVDRGIVRLHIGVAADRPSRLLIPGAPAACDWSCQEENGGWRLEIAGVALRIRRQPFTIAMIVEGRERFALEPFDQDIRGRFHHFPTGLSNGLHWLTGRLLPGEALFGLGEHFGALNRRGQAFAGWTVDADGVRSDRAYKNVPLLLSTAGYALFFDMTAPLYYDLGQRSTAAWQVTVRADHLRMYLIAGETVAKQLYGYHRLTGAPVVPPAWSFGLWMSRWGYRNRDELMAVARRLRAEQVPCDVLHLDPYWLHFHQGHQGDLEWDEGAFPDPKGMIEELRQMGFRLSLWQSPYIPTESGMYREGERQGFLVKDAKGQPVLVREFSVPSAAVDFTNPGAVAWFQEKNRRLLEMGVAVMKTDFAEDLPEDAVAFDGTPVEQLHNFYPLLYQKAVFEVTAQAHGRGLVWARSGYAGSQRYPVQWGGDPGCTFADMAASLRGALSWILSGMAFASFDMGGFFGIPRVTDPPSPELYIRWSQMGLFFSHARAHGHTAPREPWAYGERALEIFRRYARLRYRLLPYIYSAALRAAEGIPLVRPLVFDYPNDPATWQIDDEYLFAHDFLVAPMFEPEGERTVYLTEGRWFDYWDDRAFEGPRSLRYSATLDRLPLFVKAGAVIAVGPELQFSDEKPWHPLSFEVYPGGPRTRVLEVNDGQRRLALTLEQTERSIELRGGPLPYAAEVRVHRPGQRPATGRVGEPIEV